MCCDIQNNEVVKVRLELEGWSRARSWLQETSPARIRVPGMQSWWKATCNSGSGMLQLQLLCLSVAPWQRSHELGGDGYGYSGSYRILRYAGKDEMQCGGILFRRRMYEWQKDSRPVDRYVPRGDAPLPNGRCDPASNSNRSLTGEQAAGLSPDA